MFRIQLGPKVVGYKGFICIIIHIWAQSVRAKYTSQLSWQVCLPFLNPHRVHFLWMAFFLNRQTVPVFLHFFLWPTFKSKTLCLRVTLSVIPNWVIPADYKYILFAFDYIALSRYYINCCNLSACPETITLSNSEIKNFNNDLRTEYTPAWHHRGMRPAVHRGCSCRTAAGSAGRSVSTHWWARWRPMWCRQHCIPCHCINTSGQIHSISKD